MPPVVENTSGVKDACTTSLTWSPYSCFFCASWHSYIQGGDADVEVAWCVEIKNPYIGKPT